MKTSSWFNRSTAGISLTSLFSDISHEMGTAILPTLLLSLGAGPAALGIIEGLSDGISSFSKLAGGLWADRVEQRKPLASVGYLITALGTMLMGLSTRWSQILLCRVAAWIGRGSRGPARDVLMLEATTSATAGKAFGLERAADALGAVLGPILALTLIHLGEKPSHAMLWAFVPGLLAFLCITFVVVEKPFPLPAVRRSLALNLSGTGRPFQQYLVGIFIFGCGDFSRTLLIFYAVSHMKGGLFSWTGGVSAIAFYILHNAASAVAALPLGVLSDRVGPRRIIVAGYLFGAAVTLGFGLLTPTPLTLLVLFIGAGLSMACEEVCEKARAAELLPAHVKGTGMGLLGAANGVGDMVSSVLVGTLWAMHPSSPALGFLAAGALQMCGALWIART